MYRNLSPRGNRRRFEEENLEDAPEENRCSKPLPGNPVIVERDNHCISRRDIDFDALKVMGRLISQGYKAFLVGGGVRDLLLNRKPKDFDIGTDASPDTVRRLFRNSRLIGRRFRINHVYFRGGKIIEVSTFRKSSADDEVEETETLKPDNTYGDAETDAFRRDLTINGLFYDLATFSVIDYVGGLEDLEKGIIRVIGVPEVRFQEDPIRMIRAIRHAARTGFIIEPETHGAILACNDMIALAAKSRLHEEFMRELRGGYSERSFLMLHEYGILENVLPDLARRIKSAKNSTGTEVLSKITEVLRKIDDQVRNQEREVSTAVALLAIHLGNLSDDFAATLSVPVLECWDMSGTSFVAECRDRDSQEELNIEDSSEEIATVAPRRRRSKSSPLMKSLLELFAPLAVSRNDRELMEQLLSIRFALVESKDQESFFIPPEGYYADILLLLKVIARTDDDYDLVEMLETLKERRSRKNSHTRMPSRGQQNRQRRRRPR